MATRERIAADELLDMPYEISLVRRAGETGAAWHAQVQEFPGCEATGSTEEEALSELRAEMARWIARTVEAGRTVPPPRAAATHSGRLLVRMPPSMHADLARLADREKVSLNTLIVGILGGATAWRNRAGGQDSPAARPAGAEAGADPGVGAGEGASRRGGGRFVSVALATNLVVLVVVGLLAVGLLIALLLR